MRAKYFSFSPSAVDTDGLADGLTGAGPWDSGDFVTTATPDGLAHQLNLTSAQNLSALTITLTGTDADDNAITEDVTGPNATTVESTKYFKTLTAVSSSGTLSTNTLDIGWVDEFVSKTIPLDHYANNPATVQLTVGGTIDVDIEDTISDIRDGGTQDSWTWLTDANFDDATASVGGELATHGIRAIRLKANSYSSSATVDLAITQSR
jgi:hypothetical protein